VVDLRVTGLNAMVSMGQMRCLGNNSPVLGKGRWIAARLRGRAKERFQQDRRELKTT
jgi:hypothetical protein